VGKIGFFGVKRCEFPLSLACGDLKGGHFSVQERRQTLAIFLASNRTSVIFMTENVCSFPEEVHAVEEMYSNAKTWLDLILLPKRA
jgi:hypothetical protein